MAKQTVTKINAIIFIFLSGLASWGLATIGVKMDHMELGALLNLFGPPIVALTLLLLFFILDYAAPRIRFTLMIILIVVNLFYGLSLRFASW
jgi:hypothetical protein